jgi:hypothetical protein
MLSNYLDSGKFLRNIGIMPAWLANVPLNRYRSNIANISKKKKG